MSVSAWPDVRDEFSTVALVMRGMSLARFGDGELKVMCGKAYNREPANGELTAELLRAFQRPPPACLVGVPTMDQRGPKGANWLKHRGRFMELMSPSQEYCSAFVSRPDSAPWISTPAYALLLERLWDEKGSVAIVSEPANSLLRVVRHENAWRSPRRVHHVECPSERAYSQIDRLEGEVLATGAELALLSCGPTASCLAARLSRRNVQGVDLGSAGGFLWKLLQQVRR